MINSLVCVPSPFLDTHPGPPKGREEPPPTPPKEGSPSLRAMIDNVIMN